MRNYNPEITGATGIFFKIMEKFDCDFLAVGGTELCSWYELIFINALVKRLKKRLPEIENIFQRRCRILYRTAPPSPDWIAQECVHFRQQEEDGLIGYCVTWWAKTIKDGYHGNSYELEAHPQYRRSA